MLTTEELKIVEELSKIISKPEPTHHDFGRHMNVGCGSSCEYWREALTKYRKARKEAADMFPKLVLELEESRTESERLKESIQKALQISYNFQSLYDKGAQALKVRLVCEACFGSCWVPTEDGERCDNCWNHEQWLKAKQLLEDIKCHKSKLTSSDCHWDDSPNGAFCYAHNEWHHEWFEDVDELRAKVAELKMQARERQVAEKAVILVMAHHQQCCEENCPLQHLSYKYWLSEATKVLEQEKESNAN